LDKGLLIFIAMGIGAIYFTTTAVESIQDDDRYKNSSYSENSEKDDREYQGRNSIGDIILDVSSVDVKKQVTIWNRSEMKNEFLTNFPNFANMRDFVDDNIVGDALKQKLKKTIDIVEDKFIGGEMGAFEAKKRFTF
jgi:hypothetical protein